MGLSLLKCLQWAQKAHYTHLCSNRVRIGRSRSSTVDDFGILVLMESACNFLLVRHSNLGHILYPFWRYGDLLAENCDFPTPVSFSAPAFYVPFKISRWS